MEIRARVCLIITASSISLAGFETVAMQNPRQPPGPFQVWVVRGDRVDLPAACSEGQRAIVVHGGDDSKLVNDTGVAVAAAKRLNVLRAVTGTEALLRFVINDPVAGLKAAVVDVVRIPIKVRTSVQ